MTRPLDSEQSKGGSVEPIEVVAEMLGRENEKLRQALAWCLRDRREADKVYLHATSALGPNQASNVLAEEPTPIERKRNLPDPEKRTPRCGPWVDGVCQKCGDRDIGSVSPNSPFGI